MSLEWGTPFSVQQTALHKLLLYTLLSSTEGGQSWEKMREGAFCSFSQGEARISSAQQRDGCTGCSSIRDPQSDYKDTNDLSALKKKKIRETQGDLPSIPPSLTRQIEVCSPKVFRLFILNKLLSSCCSLSYMKLLEANVFNQHLQSHYPTLSSAAPAAEDNSKQRHLKLSP